MPWLYPGQKRGISGKTDEIQMMFGVQLIVNVSNHIDFFNVPKFDEMLTFNETG